MRPPDPRIVAIRARRNKLRARFAVAQGPNQIISCFQESPGPLTKKEMFDWIAARDDVVARRAVDQWKAQHPILAAVADWIDSQRW